MIQGIVKRLDSKTIFRGNPLISRFVRDLTYSPSSLVELAGRQVVSSSLPISNLPLQLKTRLSSAKCCPNPNCSGVYFDQQYKQVSNLHCKQDLLITSFADNKLVDTLVTNYNSRSSLLISVVVIGCLYFNFCVHQTAWLIQTMTHLQVQTANIILLECEGSFSAKNLSLCKYLNIFWKLMALDSEIHKILNSKLNSISL